MSQFEQIEILLVEDNAEDAEMTMRALRKRNLANQLYWVKDGAEALDYLFGTGPYAGRDKNHPPKLVLLDIKMPKVDGIEVLRRIKASDLRTVPVVVMTSSNEERDVVESYRLGVNSYIVKPVLFEAFLDTVAKIGLYWVLTNRDWDHYTAAYGTPQWVTLEELLSGNAPISGAIRTRGILHVGPRPRNDGSSDTPTGRGQPSGPQGHQPSQPPISMASSVAQRAYALTLPTDRTSASVNTSLSVQPGVVIQRDFESEADALNLREVEVVGTLEHLREQIVGQVVSGFGHMHPGRLVARHPPVPALPASEVLPHPLARWPGRPSPSEASSGVETSFVTSIRAAHPRTAG